MDHNRNSSSGWLNDDFTHRALDIADALATLAYLVRLDAGDPEQVRAYANQMEERVGALQRLIGLADWPVGPAGEC